MKTKTPLSFGRGNAKLSRDTYTFSLPSGFTCPGALECLARANRETGKITDGPTANFRCFSASQEAAFPSVRRQRWGNLEALRGLGTRAMADVILASLPAKAKLIRIHVGGDFFSQAYFDAWCLVAMERKDVIFYAYTKSLPFWIDAKARAIIPDNLRLTASFGSRFDHLILQHGLRFARVILSEAEANGLEIDHDDSHAQGSGPSFALLIHGTQPAGSNAAEAMRQLKLTGWTGYSVQKKPATPTPEEAAFVTGLIDTATLSQ